MEVETYWNEEKRPLRPGPADSTRKVVEAANSPPTDRPWSSRAVTRTTGEKAPAAVYAGVRPTSRLLPPMSRMVTVSAVRRPRRSAIAPNRSPPTGRMKKPTAKTAKVESSGTRESPAPDGKTCRAMWVARKVYAYQSYHSTALPTDAASS